MPEVFAALLSAGLVFFLHLVCFRLGWVRYQVHGLLLIILLGFGFFLLLVWRFSSAAAGTAHLPLSSALLYFLISLTYLGQVIVLCYGSPSLDIINCFRRYGSKELSKNDLEKSFTNERLIYSRLTDLCKYGHVQESSKRLRITPKGRFSWNLVRSYRRLLGREIGG